MFLVALDTMLLAARTVYPLILGFVDTRCWNHVKVILIKLVTEYPEKFRRVAGHKIFLYSIFSSFARVLPLLLLK